MGNYHCNLFWWMKYHGNRLCYCKFWQKPSKIYFYFFYFFIFFIIILLLLLLLLLWKPQQILSKFSYSQIFSWIWSNITIGKTFKNKMFLKFFITIVTTFKKLVKIFSFTDFFHEFYQPLLLGKPSKIWRKHRTVKRTQFEKSNFHHFLVIFTTDNLFFSLKHEGNIVRSNGHQFREVKFWSFLSILAWPKWHTG